MNLVLATGLIFDDDSSDEDYRMAEILYDQARRDQTLVPELSGGESMIMIYALPLDG